MTWSAWGLDGLDDSASDRFVIEGGGRLLALGLRGPRPEEVERLSPRWSVSVGSVSASFPRPAAGDVVIWRSIDGSNPRTGYAWGSPTRVLSVHEDEPGIFSVSLLQDAQADARGPGDYTEWLQEALAEDCAVPAGEEWPILGYWGLRPLCPRCGATSRAIQYGFPMGGFEDDDDIVIGGCVVGDDDASFQCSSCGHGF
jgi:predicted RNA-binding Zn-ribbon protein involved in translation (DUF1610 family)